MIDKNTLNFEVITDKHNWQKALGDFTCFDFYHTYDYHYLSKKEGDKAVLLKYSEENKIILFPLFIRKINGTNYFDATSVYGYAGPLQKNIDVTFDNKHFHKELIDFFIKENIISAFSSLNPYITYQESILNNIGKMKTLNKVVNIELTKTLEEQRIEFSKTTKRYLNKAKNVLDLKIFSNAEWLDIFIKLYYETMDRVKADKKYYFTKNYFYNLVKSTGFKVNILYAIHKETNQVVSAALMIKTNNIIQYHLSGTKNDYLHLSPMRFIINQMRIRGTQEKFEYFNLGGGLGGNFDDLFRFKSSFSKDHKVFRTWNLIVNKEIYNQLVLKNKTKDQTTDTHYFPLYRLQENKMS